MFGRHAVRPAAALAGDRHSAHSYGVCTTLLDFFAEHLAFGEHLVVEACVDRAREGRAVRRRTNRAIGEFLDRRPGVFEVDHRYTDMFGINATYNPNGYLVRTQAS